MFVSPRRSVRAVVAGLATLAVVAVGCAPDGGGDEDTDTPSGSPGVDESDAESPTGADGEATGDAPTPDTQPSSTEPAAEPVNEPVSKPAAKPAEPAAQPSIIADGNHAGRLVSITTTDVTVQLVRVLSGEEAIAAATADGGAALDDHGTLPNDVYIQDLDRVVTVPVAGDAGFRIYDCSSACELVGTTLTALASGEAVPYGGPNAVADLTVEQGVVVSLEEQYLP